MVPRQTIHAGRSTMTTATGSMIRKLVLSNSIGLGGVFLVHALAGLLAGSPLAGQLPPNQELPTVEPSLSLLFDSDNLHFGARGAISPDGRWLVFPVSESETEAPTEERVPNLWIAPLDGSADPAPLTWGQVPLWFPSGDRILFGISRPDLGGGGWYLMTLDIDPATGQARGSPRQLTVETVEFSQSFDISPDGEEVVYAHRSGDGRGHILKILPARGGQARTLGTGLGWRPIWAEDGFIYGLSRTLAGGPEAGYDWGWAVRRVPVTGGEVELVSNWPGAWSVSLSGDARTFLYRLPPLGASTEYEVASVWGERWARLSLPENMGFGQGGQCFRRDVLECLARTTDGAAPLKVVPINGGPPLQLTEGHMKTRPLGWTADGREVVFRTNLDGTLVVMSAPITGGAKEELYRIPVRELAYGPSVLGGRYMLFGRKDGPEGAAVLSLLDLQTGSEREVSRTPWTDYTYYNTSRTLDGRFLYAERKESRFEFMALDPEGDPELLRAFPDTAFPPILGVHGDRIAYWTREEGESSTLHLARVGEQGARTVLTFPGRMGERFLNAPSWSPDGRFLVSGYDVEGAAGEDALVVEIDASGEVVGDPKVINDLPSNWAGLRWMPDSQGFLVGADGQNVWLASIRGDEPPVNVTQEEVGALWFYQLSPDGRYIAVSPEVTLGTSLWRIDLERVLASYR